MLENLEWLTQKTEDPKSNKKVPISTSTPCFQVYPPFLAKNFVPPPPPSDSIFWRSLGGVGVSNYVIYMGRSCQSNSFTEFFLNSFFIFCFFLFFLFFNPIRPSRFFSCMAHCVKFYWGWEVMLLLNGLSNFFFCRTLQ